MEQTNWRSLGQKIGKGLINAVIGQVVPRSHLEVKSRVTKFLSEAVHPAK
jgi:hypothetical protein